MSTRHSTRFKRPTEKALAGATTACHSSEDEKVTRRPRAKPKPQPRNHTRSALRSIPASAPEQANPSGGTDRLPTPVASPRKVGTGRNKKATPKDASL